MDLDGSSDGWIEAVDPGGPLTSKSLGQGISRLDAKMAELAAKLEELKSSLPTDEAELRRHKGRISALECDLSKLGKRRKLFAGASTITRRREDGNAGGPQNW